MQLVRTLHSQGAEKSLFVLRLSTWNMLSGGAPQAHSGEGAPRTQSHPCLWRASPPRASSRLRVARFHQTLQWAEAKWQGELCI